MRGVDKLVRQPEKTPEIGALYFRSLFLLRKDLQLK